MKSEAFSLFLVPPDIICRFRGYYETSIGIEFIMYVFVIAATLCCARVIIVCDFVPCHDDRACVENGV